MQTKQILPCLSYCPHPFLKESFNTYIAEEQQNGQQLYCLLLKLFLPGPFRRDEKPDIVIYI